MTHAGTMDLGGSAQTKQSGSRWPAVILTLIVVVATIAAVWFASSAGLVGGAAAKPAADRYDTIKAQRYPMVALPGAVALPNDLSVRRGYPIEFQPGAVALPHSRSARHGRVIVAQPGAVKLPDNLSVRRGYAIQDAAQTVPLSSTSGTFHLGR